MQQSIIQQITSSLSDSCAWLVLDNRAKIQELNTLAKNLLVKDKKSIQKTSFLMHLEGFPERELEDVINGKSWTGDIKIKKTSKEYYTNFLPIQGQNPSETKIIVSIYPTVSEKLTQRSPKFFKLLQNTSDGVLLLDAETGRIVETNETALKYLGYTYEEILEKNFKQIDVELNGQTGLSWKKFLIELKQKSPEALQTLSRYIQKNDLTIPVESSISYEENGGEAYISILFKDVSSHDRIEEILDSQQKKFQLLIENLDDSILLLDEGANIMYASPATHKNWGYRDNELQEQYLFDLVHPYDSSLVKKIFFEIINTRRKLFKTTFRILYKDGSDHWMEVKAKNLLREPSINAVLMIVQNVTQQTLAEEKIIQALETEKKLNEELAQREEKLKNTLELIKQKEIELKKTNQILEDAQTFAKMGSWYVEAESEAIAWSKQTFIAFGMNPLTDRVPRNRKELRQLIHEDDRAKLAELYQKLLLGESENYEIELRQYQKNDGTYRWFLTKAQSIKNEEGNIMGISGITLDIHERKLAEEKLIQTNEELSKANSELDRFVYSVSHDLRAPISSLLGLIQLSRMTDKVEEVKQYMSLQEKSIQRLDNFIKDILDYSRNARLEFTPEHISFKEILENCFEQHSHMENAKRIETIIKINEEKVFYSDKNRLNIIFNNLLSNAIKYANQRQLRCYIQVFVETDDKEVKVEIQDNGIGIGKEHINKVFNMFYRANDSLAGSGLGLYIVKETINKLQGSIKLDSELGQGTRIVLTLPNKKNES
ncbi:MAG: PAS domain S-box protein [Raineya sp.]|jgi:PAS domain S-box-containing protein|nr:PAS domain S-box protein [Raineya sp.]